MPTDKTVVRLRLLRADDAPATNPDRLAYDFGLQDTKQGLTPPVRRADGMLVFDFTVEAKTDKDPDRPVFGGPFASGPANDRFVYLSWRARETGAYINRVKARLVGIDWGMIRASELAGRPLEADTTGWRPGSNPVAWRVADR